MDIRKLKGYKDHYSLRVGRYRVLFKLQEPRTVIVYAILTRGLAYKKS